MTVSNYGANSGQVARFVQRVRSLTEAQWSDILARKAGYAAVFGSYDQQLLELDGYKTHGVDQANKIVESAERDSGLKGAHHERWRVGMEAILALLYPKVMWPEHFSAAYGPFEHAIPIADLGPGSAPVPLSMPETLGGRFVARLRNFPNQTGAMEIAFALQDAGGTERIEKAVDAALNSGIDVDAALEVNSQIAELLREEVAKLTDLSRMVVTKVGGTEDQVQERSQFYQSQRDGFRLCAFRGAVGLMARALVSDEDFALLYLPFIAFIPPASLEAFL